MWDFLFDFVYFTCEKIKAGEGKLGTDEAEFVNILCHRSFPQLRATFAAYTTLTGHDIETAVKVRILLLNYLLN
jgi:hypothetical protein